MGSGSSRTVKAENYFDLASGKGVREGFLEGEGFLVDFLDNIQRSAKLQLSIYRLEGGAGYLWAASFDENGRGHLRFSAVDAASLAKAGDISKRSVAPREIATQPDTILAKAGDTPKPPVAPTETAPPPTTASDGAKENEDRKRRLEQLAAQTIRANPTFYDYLVKKTELAGLPTDIPVLRVVFEERVFFDTAQWNIRSDANPVLDIVAETMRKEAEGTALFVAGHTDSRGSDDYNLDLSVRRASSVAEELARRGTGATSLWKVGFGKAIPLRPNDTPEDMAVNRRVEFVIASRRDAAAYWLSKQGNFLCAEGNGPMPEFCKPAVTPPQSFRAEEIYVPDGQRTSQPEVLNIPLTEPEISNLSVDPPPIFETGRPQQ